MFFRKFRQLERLILMTKQELEAQIKELEVEFYSKLAAIDDMIRSESMQQKQVVDGLYAVISTLEAKILQGKNEPGVDINYSVDLSSLKAMLGKLDSTIANIAAIVPDEKPVEVEPTPEPIMEDVVAEPEDVTVIE